MHVELPDFQASIFILFILDATREEALGTLGSPETRHVKKSGIRSAWLWRSRGSTNTILSEYEDKILGTDDRMFLLRFSLLCPWLKCGGQASKGLANIHESDQDKLTLRRWQEWTAWLQPKSCWNAVKSYDVGFWEDLGSEIGNRTGKSTSSRSW